MGIVVGYWAGLSLVACFRAVRRPAGQVSVALALLASSGSMAQITSESPVLRADWVYLSPSYGWVQHSQEIDAYPAQVPLTARHQDIQDLWWASHPRDHSVQYLHGLEDRLLVPGTQVTLRTDDGLQAGEIMQVLPAGLLIALGDQARLLAPDNFHRLTIPLAGRQTGRLMFHSAEDTPTTRTWAYRTGQISAQVLYRLDMSAQQPVLYQDLRIENPGDQAVHARGLSYHPGDDGGRQVMISRSLTAMSEEAVNGPEEQVSGQQAVMSWSQPVQIAANSTHWVRVQNTALAAATNEYRWRWHGQATSAAPADWFLTLTGDEALPRLPGAVAVSWFDRGAATLGSYYQPEGANRAVLSLGNNSQVTLTAQATDEPGEWHLQLNNRLDTAVPVLLELHHPRSHQTNVLPRTEARTLSPGRSDLIVRFNDRRIEVEAP